MDNKLIKKQIRKLGATKKRNSLIITAITIVAWWLLLNANNPNFGFEQKMIFIVVIILLTLLATYTLITAFFKAPKILNGIITDERKIKRTERFSEEREQVYSKSYLVCVGKESFWGRDISPITGYENGDLLVGDTVVLLYYGGRNNYIIK